MRTRLRWYRARVLCWAQKRAHDLWRRLPANWRHTLTCWELGRLTTEPRLAKREVPVVTIGELLDTMRDVEGVRS